MQQPRWSSCLAVAAGLGTSCLGLVLLMAQEAPPGAPMGPGLAQMGPPRRAPLGRAFVAAVQADDEMMMDGVFLPPDRTAKRRLDTAQEMLGERRYGEAVRLLGTLLESSEDFFFKPDPAEPVYRSLKAEAGRMIAALPDAGRQSYELQYGARARLMLKQAIESGRPADLAEVARQFFYTEPGQDATFLLGRDHLDHNRPLAAAMCFERLRTAGVAAERFEPALSLSLANSWLRGGKPDEAKAALLRLKRSQPGTQVVVGGKPVRLFTDDAQAVAWMSETFGPQQSRDVAANEGWALFRGDESRNAPSDGGRPLLKVRWRQRTADDRLVERFVSSVRRDYLSQEIVALPSFHPLAVGDVVLMRTALAIQAVDFRTGKLIWRYAESDESFDRFLKAGSAPQPGQNVQLLSGLDQRMWEDATYGTLSSDRDNVYYVEDLGLGVPGSPLSTVLPNGRRVYVNSRTTNRLAARELRTQGKLLWEIGGADGGDEAKLAGAFFLGPPLPLMGQLYALAEVKGQEIRLVALAPDTGRLAWSQQLAVVDSPVSDDVFRRNSGAAPSYADGVLVCPTAAGAVVAIDLSTRSLLWGYQYPRFQQSQPDRFNAARFALYPGSERRGNEHWVDGTITIADGRALVTPVESDQIYCLHLPSGKELWKQDRDEHLYVACVHDGRVILVGRDRVSAVSLTDGEPAWPDLELAPGSMPSGRGFYSGHDYYLPLTTAEVARINLDTGQIDERSRSRNGDIPGNLICFRDAIVSQGADYLDAYDQLDALKRHVAEALAARPDDPEALASLAAVKLDEGSLAQAIELFRRSQALAPNETTRDQLIAAIIEGLQTDFAAHRDKIEELDGLIERREQRLEFLRVVATGMQSAGEVLPAFETYLKLIDEDPSPALDTIDAALTVDRSRWIRAQLAELRAAGSADDQQRIDAAIAARLATVIADPSDQALTRFLDVFGGIPTAAPARLALVARLDVDRLLECESLVREIEATSPADAVDAIARLAGLLDEAGRHDLATAYYGQLTGRYGDVVDSGGKTGKQLVEQLPAEHPAHEMLADRTAWPSGDVTAREATVSVRPTSQRAPRSVDLEVVGPRGPFFDDLTVSLDLQTQMLVGQDGFGQKQFRIPIHESRARSSAMNRFNVYSAPPLSYVSVNGGLLVLSMSNKVIAIDTMRGGERSPNRILWTEDLSDQIGGIQTNQGIYSRPVAVPWGGTRFVPEDTFGRRYGSIGPVTDDGVYFQRLRDLHCVDPLSGKTLWMRKNVGLGNQLFGDSELLFVAPSGDEDTLVLRAATGEKLGVRRVAPFEERMLTVGRQVLSWESHSGEHQLVMRDAWEDSVLWSFTFSGGAKAATVAEDAVAVLQPDGQFALITLADGKPRVQEKLEPEMGLIGIYLLRSGEQYLLVTNSSAPIEPGTNAQPIAGASNYPMINGRVYAFDARSGAKSWPAPALIAQYGLVTNQPARLPLMVFVRQIQARGTSRREPKTSVLCLDKRTGRVAYQNDALAPSVIGNLEIAGNPAEHTVTVTVPPAAVELTLHDEGPTDTEAK